MKRKFAEGLCFNKVFIIFVICSIIGSYYEQIYHLFVYYGRTNIWEWELRRSVIYGPLNFVYGLGGAIMVYFLVPKKDSMLKVFFLGALLGGALEYSVSYLQEVCFGTVSWDYSNRFLNINGRTTIPYMIFWGLLGVIIVYKLYPFISNLIQKIPIRIGNILVKILLVFIILDTIISLTAVVRQNLRHKNIKPYTFIGEICDKYYTDEFLKKYYPNAHKRNK